MIESLFDLQGIKLKDFNQNLPPALRFNFEGIQRFSYSEILIFKKFIDEVYDWVFTSSGAPHPVFSRNESLCILWDIWLHSKEWSFEGNSGSFIFAVALYNEPFPFNGGSLPLYANEKKRGGLYTNPLRRNWIKYVHECLSILGDKNAL